MSGGLGLVAVRRLRAGWLVLAAVGLGLWLPAAPFSSATSDAGLVTLAGTHRAQTFGFWGALLGLALVVLAAKLGHESARRDRAWLGPRPLTRARLAVVQLGGVAVVALAIATALAVATELRLPNAPSERVVSEAPFPGTSWARVDADRAWSSTYAVDPSAAHVLHLRAVPLLGVQRVAAVHVRTDGGDLKPELDAGLRLEVGSPRELRIELPTGTERLTLTHIPGTAPLGVFPPLAWIGRPTAGARTASLVLAAHWLLLALLLASLALGLGTHLSPALATLLLGALLIPAAGPLHLAAWPRAVHLAERGVIPSAPTTTHLVGLALGLCLSWALASRRPTP